MNTLINWSVNRLKANRAKTDYERAFETPLHLIFYFTLFVIVLIYIHFKVIK